MSRVFVVVFVAAAAAAVHQTAVRANGSPMPAPSGGGPSASMPVVTPEQLAAQAYNSGISHKNKGLKYETDAEKATKDREKILGKAKDEYGKALKDFKKALDLKPDAYQAFNGMGFALRKTGEPAKALQMYDKALALAPSNGVEMGHASWDGAHTITTRLAAQRAYHEAGIRDAASEINLIEVHDCFSITELVLMEDLGFSEQGRAVHDVLDGRYDRTGAVPCQTDGGGGARPFFSASSAARSSERAALRILCSARFPSWHSYGST